MFTGLITDMGRVRALADANGLRRLEIESAYTSERISLGASIMHNGVCLTVVEHGPRAGGCWWAVQAVAETLSRTTLGDLQVGDRVNLEPSLRLGDELGGHFVFGHVDGVGEIVSVQSQGADSWRVGVQAPDSMARFLAEKGSIAVDGVSLTLAAAKGAYFELAIIPHTWHATTLGQSVPGRRVNLEADMLARYVARQLQKD